MTTWEEINRQVSFIPEFQEVGLIREFCDGEVREWGYTDTVDAWRLFGWDADERHFVGDNKAPEFYELTFSSMEKCWIVKLYYKGVEQ